MIRRGTVWNFLNERHVDKIKCGQGFCESYASSRNAMQQLETGLADPDLQIANLAYWVTGTEGSNPSLSANQSQV